MENVKIGDTIKIIKMEGEPQYTDREGVVTHIDDAGQIHGTWGGFFDHIFDHFHVWSTWR